MKILLGLVGFTFFAWLLFLHWKKQQSAPLVRFYFFSLVLKLVSGLALGVLYHFYFRLGDTLAFDSAAIAMADLALTKPYSYVQLLFTSSISEPHIDIAQFLHQPRSLLLSKLLSLAYILSGSNYWISSLYFSFFSFIGFWHLSNAIARYFPGLGKASFIAFLLFPSVVFWSSGVIKESLATGAICLALGYYLELFKERNYSLLPVAILLLSLALAYGLKYYYFIFLIPPLASNLFVQTLSSKLQLRNNDLLKTALWVLVLGTITLSASFVHPNFYISRIAEVVSSHHDQFVAKSDPEDIIHYNDLSPEIGRVLANAPLALISSLYRPLPWEANGMMKLSAALENVLLLSLTILCLFYWKSWRVRNSLLLVYSLAFYVFAMATFLALSAPNFGTLARYRVGFLPFFVLLLLSGISSSGKFKWLA